MKKHVCREECHRETSVVLHRGNNPEHAALAVHTSIATGVSGTPLNFLVERIGRLLCRVPVDGVGTPFPGFSRPLMTVL